MGYIMEDRHPEHPRINDRTESIIVFTHENRNQLIDLKGTQSWVLDSKRARNAKYCVCVKNLKHIMSIEDKEAGYDENVEHGDAFLVGKISNLIRPIGAFDQKSEEMLSNRWCIEFSEYCSLNNTPYWNGDRNPVKYVDTYELQVEMGVIFEDITFNASAPRREEDVMRYVKYEMEHNSEYLSNKKSNPLKLTIEEAKKGLSNNFGVSVDNIEINIRG